MNWRSSFRRMRGLGEAPVAAETRRDGHHQALSRRVVGLVAGSAAATWVVSRQSKALAAASAVTVESGAVAPSVVPLTDASTISVDASAGSDFRVTIAGDRTLGNPANPVDGQQIIFQITQGSGGSYTLVYGSAYEFSAGIPQPTLSTTAGNTDLFGFIYNAAMGTWLLAAYVNGFG